MSSPKAPPTAQQIEGARQRRVLGRSNTNAARNLSGDVSQLVRDLSDRPSSSPMLSPASSLAPGPRGRFISEIRREISVLDRSLSSGDPFEVQLPASVSRLNPFELTPGRAPETARRGGRPPPNAFTNLIRSAMSSADRVRPGPLRFDTLRGLGRSTILGSN